ncbi:MAG: hypothetical protein WD278_18875 [Pirellulales bacterium]
MTSVHPRIRKLAILAPILPALVLAGLPGCQHFDLRKRIPWGEGEEGQLKRPMKVVGLWTDTVLSSAHQQPMRGFGGRLMFYASEEGKPCKVKGSLVVYAFDETHRDPTNVAPDRKYVFAEEQFAKHYSKSALGHSYSFWLPWDEVGGEQKEISLILRFVPEQGGVVISEETKHVLPGSKPVDQAIRPASNGLTTARSKSEVQRVQYDEEEAGDGDLSPLETVDQQPGDSSHRMKTVTIHVPSAMGRTPTAIARPRATPLHPAAPSARPSPNPPRKQSEASRDRPGPPYSRVHPLGEPIGSIDRSRGPSWPHNKPRRPNQSDQASGDDQAKDDNKGG